MTPEEIIDLYKQTDSISQVVTESHYPPKIVYMILNKAKVLNAEKRLHNGTANTKKGAFGEVEFQKLFPSALNANDMIGVNNPNYDFQLDGLLVDVKTTSPRKKKTEHETDSWGCSVRVAEEYDVPDVYVVFALDTSNEFTIKHILLIPEMVASQNSSQLTFTENSATLREYEVSSEELVEQMNLMIELKQGGII